MKHGGAGKQENNSSFFPRQPYLDTGACAEKILASSNPYGLSVLSKMESLVPVNMGDYERYQRARRQQKEHAHCGGPFATSFSYEADPDGWQSFIHPEGVKYFFYDNPNQPVPVLTEAWVYDEPTKHLIQDTMGQVFQCLVQEGVSFRPNVTRPGEYDSVSGKNQKTQDAEGADKEGLHYDQYRFPVVLVLEALLAGRFQHLLPYGGVGVDRTNPHVGWEMKSQYWAHNEFFSDFYKLTEGDLVEIDNMLSFALGNQTVSGSNSSNFTAFTPDQLRFIQQMLREFKEKPTDTRRRSVGDATILSRGAKVTFLIEGLEQASEGPEALVWKNKWAELGVERLGLGKVLDELEAKQKVEKQGARDAAPPTLAVDDDFGDFEQADVLSPPQDEMGDFVGAFDTSINFGVPQPTHVLFDTPAPIPEKDTPRAKYIRAHTLLKPLVKLLDAPPHVVLTQIADVVASSTASSISPLLLEGQTLRLLSRFLSLGIRPVRRWEEVRGFPISYTQALLTYALLYPWFSVHSTRPSPYPYLPLASL
ncbi:hypothetical protein NMY22_g11663 [Coprinellus aureogranulatus]|nr:hypothetical protein NMY22_g11663 [Coprinellus aureogranulatus]